MMKALARSVVDEDVLACSLAHSRCSVCHVWEQGTFDPMLRDMAAEKVISNLPIFLGSSGWLACAITAIAQNPARGSRGVGIGVVALWAISGVGSGRNDVLVVDILKNIFQRCGIL